MTYKVRNEEVEKLLLRADRLADNLVEAGDIDAENVVNLLMEQVRHLCQLFDEDTDKESGMREESRDLKVKNAKLSKVVEAVRGLKEQHSSLYGYCACYVCIAFADLDAGEKP